MATQRPAQIAGDTRGGSKKSDKKVIKAERVRVPGQSHRSGGKSPKKGNYGKTGRKDRNARRREERKPPLLLARVVARLPALHKNFVMGRD